MDYIFLLELFTVLAVIALGARKGGIALGMWGGVGLPDWQTTRDKRYERQ